MRIRCPNCLGMLEVESLIPGECPPATDCDRCGTSLSLMACGELGLTADEQDQRASRYAEFNEIDLPAAYSVLLGLMTLERARQDPGEAERAIVSEAPAADDESETPFVSTGEAPQVADEAQPSVTPSAAVGDRAEAGLAADGPRKGRFDAGFRQAVRDGHLTVQQAMQRGDRRLFVAQLARRHGIPMRLATLVADNKMSLHTATQRVRAPEAAPRLPGANARQKILMVSLAVVLVAGVVAQVRRQLAANVAAGRAAETNQLAAVPAAPVQPTVAPAHEPPPPTTSVQADDAGRLLRIESNTPEAILEAFCANGAQADRFQPVELVNAVPPSSWARMGLIRNFDDVESLYVIDILRDRKTGRWVAGNGADPIVPRLAPAGTTHSTSIAAGI